MFAENSYIDGLPYPLLDGVVGVLGGLADDPEGLRCVVEVLSLGLQVLQVVLQEQLVLK